MNAPLGPVDFFALEAGDCLEQLGALVARPGGASDAAFVRLARQLRGAATVARQPALAEAAGALERLGRGFADGRLAWVGAARERTEQAVDTLRELVRQVKHWRTDDEMRAGQLVAGIAELLGRPSGQGPAVTAAAAEGGVSAQVRAFVAREGALVAAQLTQAAALLRADPAAAGAFDRVVQRMQALRGLADLGELPPIPDLLDAIELAARDAARPGGPPAGAAEVAEAAAEAMTRLGRDIAEGGAPGAAAPEVQRFAELLRTRFIFAPPATGTGDAPALGAVDIVSHGEHLRDAADGIHRAPDGLPRDVQLYRAVAALRHFSPDATDPLRAAVGRVARQVHALAAGGAHDAVPVLRALADRLSSAAVGGVTPALVAAVGALAAPPPPSGPGATPDPDGDLPIVPIESLLATPAPPPAPAPTPEPAPEPGIVPIEALLAEPEAPPPPAPAPAREPDVVPVTALLVAREAAIPADAGPRSALERSFSTFARLVAERGPGAASLDGLVGRPLLDVAAAAEVPALAAPPTDDVVDIGTLCYTPDEARRRVREVRAMLTARLGARDDLPALRPLLDELLDLIPVAVD